MRAELLLTGAPVVLAGDYNVMPTELDVYKPERWVNDALFRDRGPRRLPPPRHAGLDGCAEDAPSGRAHLHVLGLFPQRLCARRRAAHRPSAAQPGRRGAPEKRRRRPRRARLGEGERPRARSGSSLRRARPSGQSEPGGGRHGRGRRSSAQAGAARPRQVCVGGPTQTWLGIRFSAILLSTRARAPPARRRSRRAPALPLRR